MTLWQSTINEVLVERYEPLLSALEAQVATMQSRVRSHLERMGF